jgi:metacaspase-1
MASEGISLHLGVNRVSPEHYGGYGGGWEGELQNCEQDAVDLQTISGDRGFAASALLTGAATTEAVRAAVTDAAESMRSGDIFVLTYSGYGGTVPDRNSDEHHQETTWVLYDRQMPEDELTSLLGLFESGVRVLVIDDSSIPGTVRRAMLTIDELVDSGEPRMKSLPPDVMAAAWRSNQAIYDQIQRSCTSHDKAVIEAAVLTVTGCLPDQTAEEGDRNGAFTDALLRAWDDGRFRGTYRTFVKKIAGLMRADQTPELSARGSGKSFVNERPLKI